MELIRGKIAAVMYQLPFHKAKQNLAWA